MDEHRQVPRWGPCLCCAVKEVISLADERYIFFCNAHV